MKRHEPVTLICSVCNKDFKSYQLNPSQYPKMCNNCRDFGGVCIICGKPAPFKMRLCGKKECRSEDARKRTIRLYSLGKPMGYRPGKDNLVNKPGIKKKILEGLARSRGRKNNKAQDGNLYRSSLEVMVANYLIENKISFEYEKLLHLKDSYALPDFTIADKILIEVCGYIVGDEEVYFERYVKKIKAYLEETSYHIVIATYSNWAGRFAELDNKERHRIDVIVINDYAQPIELEMQDVTNVDYAHFLPDYNGKCSQVHAHTSYSIGVNVCGYPIKGMVIDFKLLKQATKDTISLIDHKMVVGLGELDGTKKMIRYDKEYMYVKYFCKEGKEHAFKLPKDEVYVMEEYATIENILSELCDHLLNLLPWNVFGVKLTMSEGVSNTCSVTSFRTDGGDKLEKLATVINYHLKF